MLSEEDKIKEFLTKHGKRNMFLAKMRGKVMRKGLEGLSAQELLTIRKKMKDKDGALPFDYETFQENKEKIYE